MATCPICNQIVDSGVSACPSCGFNFVGGTQRFTAISIEDGISQPKNVEEKKTNPKLTIHYGRQKGLSYEITAEGLSIGRDPKCDVLLNDMTVSRVHAEIEKLGSAWIIKDMNSYNGVWINNKSIDIATLRDGDIIQIGKYVLKYTD